jgi:hypothetical protein
VKNSLSKYAISIDSTLEMQNRLLDEVSKEPGILSVNFHDLDDQKTVEKLWWHCLGIPFDLPRWKWLRYTNVQIDMQQRLRKLAQNHAGILNLRSEALKALG